MSKRSNWCEFNKETRKYIKQRDNNRCVVCGRTGALQIMHIFVSRAHGGKGAKENGCLGCVYCHNELDNGSNSKRTKEIQKLCENYLIEKENIKDVEKLKKELVYHKQVEYLDMNKIVKAIEENEHNIKYYKGKTIYGDISNNPKQNQKRSKNLQKLANYHENDGKNLQKKQKRCKNCKYLVKGKNKYNSTIKNYYCEITKKIRYKNSNICENYAEEKK